MRKAVLMCAGKGLRGIHLEKSGDGGEDLRLNLPSRQDTETTSRRKDDAKIGNVAETTESNSASRLEKDGGAQGTPFPIKTVLLVKGEWVHEEDENYPINRYFALSCTGLKCGLEEPSCREGSPSNDPCVIDPITHQDSCRVDRSPALSNPSPE